MGNVHPTEAVLLLMSVIGLYFSVLARVDAGRLAKWIDQQKFNGRRRSIAYTYVRNENSRIAIFACMIIAAASMAYSAPHRPEEIENIVARAALIVICVIQFRKAIYDRWDRIQDSRCSSCGRRYTDRKDDK